ncbi:MAG: biotin synthase BioB [Bacteroidales bacterium]|nr:biotin synthase BioB [Bacteroidales bacterium]
MIQDIKNKILIGGSITIEEAIALSKIEDKEALYAAADEIREKLCGNKMDMCSITNARSGKCNADCKWCSQSAFNKTNVETYELIDEKEVLETAQKNADQGVHRYSLVTSGKKLSFSNLQKLCGTYKKISETTKISMCASMGLMNPGELMELKNAGVDHYHCNLETARSFFPELVTTHTYDQKIETIRAAQAIGLKVCSGGIIGMSETMEQRLELAFELKELGILSIPINVLMQVEGTPLEKVEDLSDEEILTTIALFRFINPKAKLRFAGGRMKIKHIQEKALKAGINAALVGDYLTTIGSNVEEDRVDFEKAGFDLN